MGDLSSAIVGTKLKVPERYGRNFSVRVVTKVTTASVICGNNRFRKSDGLLMGSGGDGWLKTYARIATDADMLVNRIVCARSMLQFIKVTAENLETVERLIARSN